MSALKAGGLSALSAFRSVVLGYAGCGVLLVVLYLMLSEQVEARSSSTPGAVRRARDLGLSSSRSRLIVAQLSALFALDAFAGGFSMQTFICLWFERRWGLGSGYLGTMLMGVNLLAACR